VVHFNFGLWDAKLSLTTGTATVAVDQYRDNLLELAKRFHAGGAKVIFATTTPVPTSLLAEPKPGPLPAGTRLFEDVAPRNKEAAAALEAKGVVIDDLYTLIFSGSWQIPKSERRAFQQGGIRDPCQGGGAEHRESIAQGGIAQTRRALTAVID